MDSTKSEKPDADNPESNEHAAFLHQLLAAAVREKLINDPIPDEIEELVEHLLEYSKAYAISQELLMQMYQYPKYIQHSQEHDKLVHQIEDLLEICFGGELERLMKKLSSFQNRLDRHLRFSDIWFLRFLKERGDSPE
jgi:hemerythrin